MFVDILKCFTNCNIQYNTIGLKQPLSEVNINSSTHFAFIILDVKMMGSGDFLGRSI